MKNGPYERFDEELFGPLIPSLKIVSAVNAGYSEFDLEWFNSQKIHVTNTIEAVAEPTADTTIMLMLNTIRDFTMFERKFRAGQWKRGVERPPPDPHGLLLGIIGMGKIGKVILLYSITTSSPLGILMPLNSMLLAKLKPLA